jgi:nitric oxide reductase subunit B
MELCGRRDFGLPHQYAHRDVLTNGYWYARSFSFILSGTFHTVEWIRIVGDLVFLLCGFFPIVLAAVLSFLKRDLRPEIA